MCKIRQYIISSDTHISDITHKSRETYVYYIYKDYTFIWLITRQKIQYQIGVKRYNTYKTEIQ